MMDYLRKSIVEIHDAILRGDVTPLELVKEAIEKAKKDTNNAFEYIAEKEALEAVQNLDESLKDSLFYGIPVVIKDNFSTKDIPTTGSSNMLNGYIPIFSSEVVLRLEKAGAIVIGKTTLDELAMGGSGTIGHKGKTYNPWDKTKTHQIGGSSCGSAAAMSAGIVPFAIGSDTGDSVRKPASFAGLVGLKPTWGRISKFGLIPFASSLDHVGFFTRNVYDSALALSVLAGRDEKDLTSSNEEVPNYADGIKESIKGKKIAVIKKIVDSISDKSVIESFNETVKGLIAKGALVEYVEIDLKILKAIYPTYLIISCAEAGSNTANLDGVKFGVREPGETFEEVVMNTRTKNFSPIVKRRLVIGSYSLLHENADELFVRAQKCRRLIVNAFNKVLEQYDAIYCPASSSIAPAFDKIDDLFSDEYLIADNYMAFANMAGLPSITLPIGFEDGLPFSGNITCRAFEEKTLFNISYHLEEVTGLKDLVAEDDK